jgi:hypothetical protein
VFIPVNGAFIAANASFPEDTVTFSLSSALITSDSTLSID